MAQRAAATGDQAFEIGDPVVHPFQGAGTIVDIITIATDEEPRQYYSIELINGNGTLMVPTDEADEVGLRNARYGVDSIREKLLQEPEELADHYRTRHANIRRKLKSGDPTQVAEAVRDLAWRERVNDLTKVDFDLKRKAKKMLVGELAAQMNTRLNTASRKLNDIIEDAMKTHRSDG